jgi:methanogenic corrinoid protein MtbC1
LVDAGRRISDVANLGQAELESLASEDEAARVPSGARLECDVSAAGGGYLDMCLKALSELDEDHIEATLAEASIALGHSRMRRELLVPLMQTIGERWRDGSLRVVHEHLASAIVRSFLGSFRNNRRLNPNAPRLIVTTPSGHPHELGALLAASAAEESGWEITYLGPNLPAEEIAAGVRQKNAKTVALSIVYATEDHFIRKELNKLRDYLGPDVTVFVGGRAAERLRSVLRDLDMEHVDDLEEFRERLEALSRRS